MPAPPPDATAGWSGRHLGRLVAAAAAAGGQRPLVTFTDGGTGERTELGCATFENWVAKTANLLVEELGLGPGGVLASPLGSHWTTLVIQAAAWRVGAAVALPGAGVPATAVARHEDDPPVDGAAPELLVGAGFGGRLTRPAGTAIGFAEEVLAFPDDFVDEAGDPGDAALVLPGESSPLVRTHADLLAAAAEAVRAAGLAPGDRYASTLGLDRAEGVVAGTAAVLALGGGLLLVRATAPDRLPGLLAGERCAALFTEAGAQPADPGVPTVELPPAQ